MRLWVDPPGGWAYDFPKIWDSKSGEDILTWLVKNGYPQHRIDEFGEAFYTRNWRVDDDNPSDS